MKGIWLLVMLAAAGCGEPTGTQVGTTVTRVVVWPTTLSLAVAQSFALETTLNNSSAGQTPSFTCTSNLPSIVTVDNCVVRAVAVGNATIAVTSSIAAVPVTIAVAVTNGAASCPAIPGTHVYRTTLLSGPDSIATMIGMRTNTELQIIRNTDGSVMVSGSSPFINTAGVFSLDCAMSTVGTGSVGNVSNVSARLTGPVLVNGVMTFRYTVGTNRTLPGGEQIVYTFTRQ